MPYQPPVLRYARMERVVLDRIPVSVCPVGLALTAPPPYAVWGAGPTKSALHRTPVRVSRGTTAQTARKLCVCRPVIMEAFVPSLILVPVVLGGSTLTAQRVKNTHTHTHELFIHTLYPICD